MAQDERPPLTEAQYAVLAESRMQRFADLFTELLPQEARDAGIRLEWATSPDLLE